MTNMERTFKKSIFILSICILITSCETNAIDQNQGDVSTFLNTDVVLNDGSAPLFNLSLVNTGNTTQNNVPITFGHPFAQGTLNRDTSFTATTSANDNLTVQVDPKAYWQDGSLKHAVVSLIVPALNANSSLDIGFSPTSSSGQSAVLSKGDLTASGFSPEIEIMENGNFYSSDVISNLNDPTTKTWLEGPIVSEWIVPSEIIDRNNVEHRHLSSFYHVRYYATGDMHFSAIVENTNAFYEEVEDSSQFSNMPKNVTYDWTIKVNNQTLDSANSLEHFARSRWRKSFSSNNGTASFENTLDSNISLVFDKDYIIDTRAVASYNPESRPSQDLLQAIERDLSGANTEPMGIGMIDAKFSAGVEGSLDAAWSVSYLLSGDIRARKAMLANANAAASIGIHYRDERTSSPNNRHREIVSIQDHPGATIRDDSENIPFFDGDRHFNTEKNKWVDITPDTAHQNSFAYMPYLLTGDYFYLEEMQFWANHNFLWRSANQRGRELGLITPNTARGQAWALRTLANSAFITPDSHINKQYFEQALRNNIDFYVDGYARGDAPLRNILGILNNGNGITNESNRAGQGWMDHWFTASVNRVYQMGYTEIKPFLDYKAQVAVSTLTDPNFCYIFASTYKFYLRDGKDQPLYDWKTVYETTIREDYNGNGEYLDILSADCGSQQMADLISRSGAFRSANYRAGQMIYSNNSSASYYPRLQGAVAAAVDAGIPGAEDAWNRFLSSTTKPDYNAYDKGDSNVSGNKYNIIPIGYTVDTSAVNAPDLQTQTSNQVATNTQTNSTNQSSTNTQSASSNQPETTVDTSSINEPATSNESTTQAETNTDIGMCVVSS